MTDRETFQNKIKQLNADLCFTYKALAAFEALAENNVYDNLEDALATVEEALTDEAHEDCEGSYCFGSDEYKQEFMVDNIRYIGTLAVEYNRRDRTYYYVENSTFSYSKGQE